MFQVSRAVVTKAGAHNLRIGTIVRVIEVHRDGVAYVRVKGASAWIHVSCLGLVAR